eukprot:UN25521
MMSGIGDFDTPETEELQFQNLTYDLTVFDDMYLAPRELTSKPGTANYSSTNFEVLGVLLAALNDVDTWEDYDQTEVIPDTADYKNEIIFPKTWTL